MLFFSTTVLGNATVVIEVSVKQFRPICDTLNGRYLFNRKQPKPPETSRKPPENLPKPPQYTDPQHLGIIMSKLNILNFFGRVRVDQWIGRDL